MTTEEQIEYYINLKGDWMNHSNITTNLAIELKATRAKLEITINALEKIQHPIVLGCTASDKVFTCEDPQRIAKEALEKMI